jgi:hypothetical protein
MFGAADDCYSSIGCSQQRPNALLPQQRWLEYDGAVLQEVGLLLLLLLLVTPAGARTCGNAARGVVASPRVTLLDDLQLLMLLLLLHLLLDMGLLW